MLGVVLLLISPPRAYSSPYTNVLGGIHRPYGAAPLGAGVPEVELILCSHESTLAVYGSNTCLRHLLAGTTTFFSQLHPQSVIAIISTGAACISTLQCIYRLLHSIPSASAQENLAELVETFHCQLRFYF